MTQYDDDNKDDDYRSDNDYDDTTSQKTNSIKKRDKVCTWSTCQLNRIKVWDVSSQVVEGGRPNPMIPWLSLHEMQSSSKMADRSNDVNKSTARTGLMSHTSGE